MWSPGGRPSGPGGGGGPFQAAAQCGGEILGSGQLDAELVDLLRGGLLVGTHALQEGFPLVGPDGSSVVYSVTGGDRRHEDAERPDPRKAQANSPGAADPFVSPTRAAGAPSTSTGRRCVCNGGANRTLLDTAQFGARSGVPE